ncbi:NmrA family NAD(P)-binding protein [Geminicoccus roseus]|uniref:NmrA family NAD(P)-binding protein n=1 Tax=Geminicoccus roseus TaxID=404900 RepID=UPI0003FA4EF7|nr:NAD(P)H-binding protein [Geminicoccus roseus]
MYAVMGATGKTGGAVLAELRRRGARVRVLARDPDRARHLAAKDVELVSADLADPDGLAEAMEGAEGAYVLLPPDPQAADALAAGRAQAQAIAQAVTSAGLPHVVALSSGGAHLHRGTGLIRTLYELEGALCRTEVAATLVRACDFMENWSLLLPGAVENGVLASPRLPLDAKMQMVSAEDVGRIAAACLLEPDGDLRIVDVLGPEDYAPQDVADAVGRVAGRPVRAVPLPGEALYQALVGAGIGPDYARGTVEIYEGLNSGRIRFEEGVGEIRRGSVTLDEAVRRMLTAG